MTFGNFCNIATCHHQAWIRKSLNPALLRARKVQVLVPLTVLRHVSGTARSTPASPRILFSVTFPPSPPEETTSVHEEVQRRVTGREKWVYSTGVSLYSRLSHFTARLRPCWDWRNNRSIFNAEFKTKLDPIYKGEHTFIIIHGGG